MDERHEFAQGGSTRIDFFKTLPRWFKKLSQARLYSAFYPSPYDSSSSLFSSLLCYFFSSPLIWKTLFFHFFFEKYSLNLSLFSILIASNFVFQEGKSEIPLDISDSIIFAWYHFLTSILIVILCVVFY
jgi:hypothetical protein